MTTVFRRGAGLAIVLALTAAAATASLAAGTREQRSACRDDAFRLCREFIPNVSRITTCMEKNKARLSRACRAQFR